MPSEASVADTSTLALDQLLEITVLLGHDMARGLAELGLNESRAHLLHVLHETGPITQRELAQTLEVAPRTITGLVDVLTEAGHVTREAHPTDRRATLVTLTPQGVELGAGLADGRLELAGQLFGDWHPAHLDSLTTGLDTLLDTLRGLLEDQP